MVENKDLGEITNTGGNDKLANLYVNWTGENSKHGSIFQTVFDTELEYDSVQVENRPEV